MTESLVEFLGRLELLDGFSQAEIEALLPLCNRVKAQAGDVICHEGDIGDMMYVIREGVVSIQRRVGRGDPIVLARLSEGMVVGEMSLVDDAPRSATLVAESESLLYKISSRDFGELKLDMDPAAFKLLRAIAGICCDRIRDVNSQVQGFIENPAILFEPEVRSDHLAPSAETVLSRVKSFVNIFGKKG